MPIFRHFLRPVSPLTERIRSSFSCIYRGNVYGLTKSYLLIEKRVDYEHHLFLDTMSTILSFSARHTISPAL